MTSKSLRLRRRIPSRSGPGGQRKFTGWTGHSARLDRQQASPAKTGPAPDYEPDGAPSRAPDGAVSCSGGAASCMLVPGTADGSARPRTSPARR